MSLCALLLPWYHRSSWLPQTHLTGFLVRIDAITHITIDLHIHDVRCSPHCNAALLAEVFRTGQALNYHWTTHCQVQGSSLRWLELCDRVSTTRNKNKDQLQLTTNYWGLVLLTKDSLIRHSLHILRYSKLASEMLMVIFPSLSLTFLCMKNNRLWAHYGGIFSHLCIIHWKDKSA